jgi:hypothetical protein
LKRRVQAGCVCVKGVISQVWFLDDLLCLGVDFGMGSLLELSTYTGRQLFRFFLFISLSAAASAAVSFSCVCMRTLPSSWQGVSGTDGDQKQSRCEVCV